MEQPQNSSGEPVDLKQWIGVQLECAQGWSLTKEMDVNQRIHTWIEFFAECTGNLCKQNGVPIDHFTERFPDFAERLTPHVDRLKWFLSERTPDKVDVGLSRTAKAVRRRIVVLDDKGIIRLDMMFPSADNPEEVLHIESVEFARSHSQVMA